MIKVNKIIYYPRNQSIMENYEWMVFVFQTIYMRIMVLERKLF